jgi:hypothetical protein
MTDLFDSLQILSELIDDNNLHLAINCPTAEKKNRDSTTLPVLDVLPVAGATDAQLALAGEVSAWSPPHCSAFPARPRERVDDGAAANGKRSMISKR